MAATQAARVTGIVLKSSIRSGSKKQEDGSTRDWQMQSAKVLVGGEDICEVSFENAADLPGRGEAVDLLVQIRQSGTFLNIDALGPWTAQHEDASS